MIFRVLWRDSGSADPVRVMEELVSDLITGHQAVFVLFLAGEGFMKHRSQEWSTLGYSSKLVVTRTTMTLRFDR